MGVENSELKIAFVFDGKYDVPDGVPNYITTLGEYYVEEGQDTSYFVGHSKVENPRVHSMGRVATVTSNGNKVSFALPTKKHAIEEVLEAVEPDVLHVQMPYSPFMAAKFIKAAKPETAVVGTFHVLPNSRWIDLGARVLSGIVSSSRNRFDQIVSVSKPAQVFAKNAFKIDSAVLPCPVDIEKLQRGNKLPEYDDGKVNIVFMGRLVERKGCQHLIEAVGLLDPSIQDKIRVLIAGKGPMAGELSEQVKAKSLNNVVEFLGYVPDADKPNLLATADIAAFPATGGESFGIVLIEAMAARAGVIIGGNNPGYSSVLGKVPESLIDPYLTSEFAALLRSLIASTDFREELHAKQQDEVKQYDVSFVGGAMLDIYRSALANR